MNDILDVTGPQWMCLFCCSKHWRTYSNVFIGGSKLLDPNEKNNPPTIWNQEKPIKS